MKFNGTLRDRSSLTHTPVLCAARLPAAAGALAAVEWIYGESWQLRGATCDGERVSCSKVVVPPRRPPWNIVIAHNCLAFDYCNVGSARRS